MIDFPPPKGLPLIRCKIKNEYIQPTEWIEELQKKRPDDVIKMIKIYEFIIAILLKSISFKNIFIDKSFCEKIDSIYKEKDSYCKDYFNTNVEFKKIFTIIHFIDFPFNIGFIENAAIDFCKTWNEYYCFIFKINDNNIDILSTENLNSKSNYEDIIKNIGIPSISYDSIYNLLTFFEEKKRDFELKNKSSSSYSQANDKQEKKDDKEVYIDKNYSSAQKKLLYREETYFHIMEALQDEELSNKLGLERPIIINNKNGFFFLTQSFAYFCAIVQEYCKEYHKKYQETEFSGIDWSYFNQCMKNKRNINKNIPFNLKGNNNTLSLKKSDEITRIVKLINGYINEPKNSSLFKNPPQINKRSPLIPKNS